MGKWGRFSFFLVELKDFLTKEADPKRYEKAN